MKNRTHAPKCSHSHVSLSARTLMITGFAVMLALWIISAALYTRTGATQKLGKDMPTLSDEIENKYPEEHFTHEDVQTWSATTESPLAEVKLVASDGAANNRFSESIAIFGDTVVVGAPGQGNEGAAYVYVRDGSNWVLQQKLTAADGASGDAFGRSVAIYENTVVVGASEDDVGPTFSDHGSAYVFVRNGTTWSQVQHLVPSNSQLSARFGYSVALYGDKMVIGAPQQIQIITPQRRTGVAYSFIKSGASWVEQQILTPSDSTQENERFGDRVAISADTVAVSSPYKSVSGRIQQGIVSVFVSNGAAWTEQAVLTVNDANLFGKGIGILGDVLTVGAPSSTVSFSAQGAAYVFARTGTSWTQQQKLTASDALANAQFGYSLSMSGNTVVIGAWTMNIGANNIQGAAYVFGDNGVVWTQQTRLTASDGAAGDRFGSSVGLTDTGVVIGAVEDDIGANPNQGSAYAIPFGPQVDVRLKRPDEGGLTQLSVNQGLIDIDAPLIFKTDPAILAAMPDVSKGLVADGVTPLLFEITIPPEEFDGGETIQQRIELEIVSGGTLDGEAIGDRLLVLSSGAWTNNYDLSFTAADNKRYAYLSPIVSDQLHLSNINNPELKLNLKLTNIVTNEIAKELDVFVRKPPIALIHGYNTDGSWGNEFAINLSSRPQDFIHTIRYGQEPADAAADNKLNTILRFDELAAILKADLDTMKASYLTDWALTRHDVVAHSQGGVLSRMLTSKNENDFVFTPFRNTTNFFRGRFHRIVTIGSPHNGTRLVRYMEAMRAINQDPDSPYWIGLAGNISSFMIWKGVSQSKFDPIGEQIALINDTNSDAPWFPDPDAKFHLVQTTVNSGAAPNATTYSYAEGALGLAGPNGALVLPDGSDGVVDFASMGGTTPETGQSYPKNVFAMPIDQQTSHAFMGAIPNSQGWGDMDAFGGTSGQVLRSDVALHVIRALDQDQTIPASERVFGPFQLPEALPQSVVDDIQTAAANVTETGPDTIEPVAPRPPGRVEGASTVLLFDFNLPAGESFASPVLWSTERYGAGGLTSQGLTVASVAGNPGRARLEVDPDVPGDIVLYGTARTISGRVIVTEPFVAHRIEPNPNSYALTSIAVLPATGQYGVGGGIIPELTATYTSTTGGPSLTLRRIIVPEEFQAVATDSAVVDTSRKRFWMFTAPGTATINCSWRGRSDASLITVTGVPQTTPTPTVTSTSTPAATLTATDTPTLTPTDTPTPSNSPGISGIVTYGNAVSGPTPPRFVSNVTITGAGSPTVMTTTGAPGANAGQYALTGFGAGSYTVTPTKTTGSNGITSFDAARISQHVAGPPNTPLTGNQLIVAEVSGNGSISSFDAGMVAKFAAGPPYAAPGIGSTSTWKFTPVNRNYASVTSSVTGEDYSALLMGEVSGNWTPSAARPAGIVESGKLKVQSEYGGPERNVAVELPTLAASTDKVIVVPVNVQGIANKGVISYEFDLRYDASVMQPLVDPVDVKDTASRGLSVVTNATEPGLLRVVVYGAMPIDENGVLLNLRFGAVGASGSVSPLLFERIMFNEGEPRVTVADGKIELF